MPFSCDALCHSERSRRAEEVLKAGTALVGFSRAQPSALAPPPPPTTHSSEGAPQLCPLSLPQAPAWGPLPCLGQAHQLLSGATQRNHPFYY